MRDSCGGGRDGGKGNDCEESLVHKVSGMDGSCQCEKWLNEVRSSRSGRECW